MQLKDDPLGKIFIQTIIPAIAQIRPRCQVLCSTMFNQSLLRELKIPDAINMSDLVASDKFFDAIKTEFVYFLVMIFMHMLKISISSSMISYRCATTWQSCLTALPLEESLYTLFSMNHTLLNGPTME